MATNQPPSPSPDGRPDQDDRPSIKIGVAASMLRRGYPPLDVANATDVPLALVELIATEHHPHISRLRAPTPPVRATSSMLAEPDSATDDHLAKPNLWVPPEESGPSRWWAVRICCAAVLVVLVSIGLAVVADVTHNSVFAIFAVIFAPLLLTLLGLCAVVCACAGHGGSPRPY